MNFLESRLKIFLLFSIISHSSFAWESHYLITQHTFAGLLSRDKTVRYLPIEKALEKKLIRFHAKSKDELNFLLKINKKWKYENKLDEEKITTISILEIIEKYSDEPDWGPDQFLFDPDQYPELWRDELKYITKKEGWKTQAFRHQYFPGRFSWASPITTFQIPQRPLGEAPARAILFYELAKDFFETGSPYWGYRFFGWSLHYVQDLFNPFHSNQTPSKKFIALQWKGLLPGIDIEKSGENLSYNHFAYEEWTDRYLKEENSPLKTALSGTVTRSIPLTFETILRDIVEVSGNMAPSVGTHCLEVFPKWKPNENVNYKSAEEFVHSPEWYNNVRKHPNLLAFSHTTTELFKKMGDFVRGIGVNYLKYGEKSPHPVPPTKHDF